MRGCCRSPLRGRSHGSRSKLADCQFVEPGSSWVRIYSRLDISRNSSGGSRMDAQLLLRTPTGPLAALAVQICRLQICRTPGPQGFDIELGGKGIRTPGARKGTTVFKTAAFDRSAIPPAKVNFSRRPPGCQFAWTVLPGEYGIEIDIFFAIRDKRRHFNI